MSTVQENNKFLVFFYGSFIPLQGVQYIVEAAKILESDKAIEFKIVGGGQTFNEVSGLAKELELSNLKFFEKVPQEKLPEFMKEADICLGIFGDTEKTQRVIPNKVYEAIAMGKPVISADTPAARELFTDKENILFCRVADAKDLAEKILELKNNQSLREKIGNNGYALFNKTTKPEIIVRNFLQDLNL